MNFKTPLVHHSLEANKQALVRAHRNGDVEEAVQLSQQRQKLKKKRYCMDCGTRCGGDRCWVHSVAHRFYRRSLAALAVLALVSSARADMVILTEKDVLKALTVAAPMTAPMTNAVPLKFYWDAATGVDAFKIYSSADLAVPLTNWMVLTNVPGTNFTCTVLMQPSKQFFFLTASNFWGEATNPSPVIGVPALPVATNFTIKPGW